MNLLNPPKVSVITVVFNNVHSIESTLRNTIKQTYSNLEIIVVDGASTDGTIDVVKKYASKIKYISEPDSGIYDAMMKGVNLATGEWLIFRNVGDYFFSTSVIEEVFNEYEDYGEDIIACNIRYFQKGWYKDMLPSYPHKSYIDGMPFHHPATFIRRKIQLKYPFPKSYKLSGDYWFFAQVLHNGGTYIHIDKILSLYDNITGASTDYYDKSLLENARIMEELGAPLNKIEKLQDASCHYKRVSELRKKYTIYNIIYKINYYYQVYIKGNWTRRPLQEILKDI